MSLPPVSSVHAERTPIEWNQTQGANLYSTGASGPAAIRPVHRVNAVESTDRLGEGVTVTLKYADRPTDDSVKDLDWTAKYVAREESIKAEREEAVAREPLHKQLVEFIQSMWRASAIAVEAAEQAGRIDQHERNSTLVRSSPLVYNEPRVKRTGGL